VILQLTQAHPSQVLEDTVQAASALNLLAAVIVAAAATGVAEPTDMDDTAPMDMVVDPPAMVTDRTDLTQATTTIGELTNSEIEFS